MVDTVRGVLRVRAWPKKRGTPKSALQRFWIDWFRQANLLAKYADPMSQVRAIEMTKGSGVYPRDVLLQAMRGTLYHWADATGWKWYSVASIEGISESLDVLAQTIGSVLVRATDRWRSPAPGIVGDVLTYQGATAAPDWQTPAPGRWTFAGALVGKTGNQGIGSGGQIAVIFNAENYDTDNIHDNAVNPTRLTVPTGWTKAKLHGCASWSSSGVGHRYIQFLKNGVAFDGYAKTRTVSAGTSEQAITSPAVDVVATDYFELIVWQNSGGNLAIVGPNNGSYFAIERVL